MQEPMEAAGDLDQLEQLPGGARVLLCAADGPTIRTDRDAVDLIGAAAGMDLKIIAVPAARLSDDFFVLRTRVAGEVVQKFVTYGRHLVIMGDIVARVEESRSLRDFVHEANQGRQLWFVRDLAELDERLTAGGRTTA